MLALSISLKATMAVGLYLCVVAVSVTLRDRGPSHPMLSVLQAREIERRHLYAVGCLAVAVMQVEFLHASPTGVLTWVWAANCVAYLVLTAAAVRTLSRPHTRAFPWQVFAGVGALACGTFEVAYPDTVPVPEPAAWLVAAVSVPLVVALLWLGATETPRDPFTRTETRPMA